MYLFISTWNLEFIIYIQTQSSPTGFLQQQTPPLPHPPCACLLSLTAWKLDFMLLLLLSHSVMSNSLRPHGLQHSRLPCQTHVHWVSDAIQPSCLLLSPSPPAINLSQHQGLFQWVGSSHQVARVLELHPPMNTQDWFPLGLTGLISLQSKGLSRVFSTTTFQKHPFFGTQLSLWSNYHIHTWLLEKL